MLLMVLLQQGNSPSIHLMIGIAIIKNNVGHSHNEEGDGAGRGAVGVAAQFEGDVGGHLSMTMAAGNFGRGMLGRQGICTRRADCKCLVVVVGFVADVHCRCHWDCCHCCRHGFP